MKSFFSGQNAPSVDFWGQLGWKYYASIKKKATEQEFSWSGLIVSMSVAFFIIIGSALGLNLAYNSIVNQSRPSEDHSKIYYLESAKILSNLS